MKKLFFAAPLAAILMSSCTSGNAGSNAPAKEDSSAEKAVIENIMTRTSIREFEPDKPIAKETLETLLKAGMAAPSAMDKRPWAFVAVTEKEVLDSLNANHPYANLKTATGAIIVCGDLKKTIEGKGSDYWVQDCSAATENILLAAHACGLGAVWCGVYPTEERVEAVKKVLGLPEEIVPLNIITLGYPAQNPQPKDKWNESNVHYQRW